MEEKKPTDSVSLNWSSREDGLGETDNDAPCAGFITTELVSSGPGKNILPGQGRLICGDNLYVMKKLLGEGLGGSAKLIYIDPPFFSNIDYKQKIRIGSATALLKRHAYTDKWTAETYLDMLQPRLALMRELLASTGVIFVHCDWRMNSRIRILLDEIYGSENFLNEIIWHYGGRGAKAVSGQFPRNHDTIYVYGKTRNSRLKKIYSDLVMTKDEALAKGIRQDSDGRFFKTAPRGDYTDKSVAELEKQGRIHRTKTGKVRIKYHLETRGKKIIEKKPISDVWTDIPDAMHSPLRERTGYATQKPEQLISRIIECSTEPGDLIVDFFAGSGTTAACADKLGRNWITSDMERGAIQTARKRLIAQHAGTFSIEELTRQTGKHAGDDNSNSNKKNQVQLNKGSRLVMAEPVFKESSDGNASGAVNVNISIKDFIIDKNDYPETSPEAQDEIQKNPLLLLDTLAVDWDFDGRIFKGGFYSVRGNGKQSSPVATTAHGSIISDLDGCRQRKIAVRVTDVFGNEAQEILEVEKP